MVNINLATEDFGSQSAYSYKRGVFVLSLLLVMAILVYLGLLFWQNHLEKQLNENISGTIADQYNQAEKQFSQSPNSRRVIDFQNRLQAAGKVFSADKPLLDNLSKIESLMIPGVYLDSLNFDASGKNLTVDGTANSFNNLAKQILSFKEAKSNNGGEYFSVTTGKTSVDKDGKIKFSLILKQN